MYLNKIEIHGFKSFGDAIKLTIPEGITGVIGPNGSGKSNVADAIRWVLGEQSAKTLRGTKMEDIIFAGTEKRRSLGYAEVAMHIKNDDRKLPIDYEDVLIKRRVYRSGESEYFINGSICRLKDIQELFMDTGVGKEGYSIIGQGQIDKVLSSKPEDRRSLFEEAAGIYKYKVRRLEAERKLEKEKENLLRVNDIMVEIESRLAPLEIEATKTRNYLQLKDQLKEKQLNLFLHEVEQINEQLKKTKENLSNLEKQIEETKANYDGKIIKQQAYKVKREELFASIQSILKQISDLEKEEQQKQGEIQINKERITNIDNLLEQIEKDTKKQEDYESHLRAEINMLKTKKVGVDLEKMTQEDILKKIQQDWQGEEERLKQSEMALETSKEGLYNKVREIDTIKLEISKEESLDEQAEYRLEQIQEAVARFNSEISHQEVAIKVEEKKEEALKQALTNKQARFAKEDELKKEQENGLKILTQKYNHTSHGLEQGKRQLGWLNQIKDDFEGYFDNVKKVLMIKKQNEAEWSGIKGVTADLISVPEKYEVAMVTALGGAMQNIVVETEKDAKAMIGLMKKRNIGRVTFLPLDTLQPAPLTREADMLSKEKGFLGLGSMLVQAEGKYQPVVDYLLGRILIVDEMENASVIARKYKHRYKIVTLEGEVFNAGGSLSGGSAKISKNNIFARARELETVKVSVAQLEEQIKAESEALEQLREAVAETTKKWELLASEISSDQDAEKIFGMEISKLNHTLSLTRASQLQLVQERIAVQESKEKKLADKERLQNELISLEEHLSEDRQHLEELEKVILTLKASYETSRNNITEKKIALSITMQNLQHIEDQILQVEKNIENLSTQNNSIHSRVEELKADRIALEQSIEMLHTDIKHIGQKVGEVNEKNKTYESDKELLEVEAKEVDGQVNWLNEQNQLLKEEHFRLVHQKEMLEGSYQKEHDKIWEQYELTYTEAEHFKKDLGSVSEVKKEVDLLQGHIKILGNINVNAIEEYEETKERYDFLWNQRLDIEKAEETLRDLIGKLTAQMHDIFREQFAVIAENFSQVFQELFGGGVAFLQLVDEENILESGIEIIAKPPGKKLQNMTLLSGGERTLTAIALIFGILKLKPSPFCVLDEIEAALDDANVLRFADYLGSLSKETQFIVITHRKGTMERADTLYGVTMQERGVSTVLSIQLEEATKYLDKE